MEFEALINSVYKVDNNSRHLKYYTLIWEWSKNNYSKRDHFREHYPESPERLLIDSEYKNIKKLCFPLDNEWFHNFMENLQGEALTLEKYSKEKRNYDWNWYNVYGFILLRTAYLTILKYHEIPYFLDYFVKIKEQLSKITCNCNIKIGKLKNPERVCLKLLEDVFDKFIINERLTKGELNDEELFDLITDLENYT